MSGYLVVFGMFLFILVLYSWLYVYYTDLCLVVTGYYSFSL